MRKNVTKKIYSKNEKKIVVVIDQRRYDINYTKKECFDIMSF